jgi:hypothetical protein
MKTIFTIVFVLLVFTTLPQAQMQLGLKAGLNIASVGGGDVDEYFDESPDSRTGFNAGIFFMYQFNKMFALQPEAYYTMKGATDNFGGVDFTLKLDYIEVPVLLKLIIPVQGSNITPSVFVGPAVGFNMDAKVKAEYQGQSAEEDIDSLVTSTDFSIIFGAGLGFMVGKNELGVDIRYSLGLSSWDDSSYNPSGDPYDVKNNVLSFNAYFGFTLL